MRDHTERAATDLVFLSGFASHLTCVRAFVANVNDMTPERRPHTDTPIWALSLAYKHAYIDAISAHAFRTR